MELKDIETGAIYHCDTQEKAIEFLSKMKEFGFRYQNGNTIIARPVYCSFEEFGDKTCYRIAGSLILRESLTEFEEKGYDVYEYVLDKDCEVNNATEVTKYIFNPKHNINSIIELAVTVVENSNGAFTDVSGCLDFAKKMYIIDTLGKEEEKSNWVDRRAEDVLC